MCMSNSNIRTNKVRAGNRYEIIWDAKMALLLYFVAFGILGAVKGADPVLAQIVVSIFDNV